MIVSPQLAASRLRQFFVSEPTVRMSVQRMMLPWQTSTS
jgi:hypothetical protein